jgi:hypothetical protein
MTTSSDSSKRIRQLILWPARLALLAYLFQLSAFDHWHATPGNIMGVSGSSDHVAHCHGASGSCAGEASAVASVDDVALTPLPPALLFIETPVEPAVLTSAFVGTPTQPPRA